MSLIRLLFVPLATTVAFCGCADPKPEGFPGVFPCTIVVTKNGEPLPGIGVMLVPETPTNNLTVTGNTDPAGKATIRSVSASYSAPGAPEGNFTIVLLDNQTVDLPEVSEEEYASWPPQKQQAWDRDIAQKTEEAKIVPLSLRNPKKSQAKVTVSSSGGEAAIDISQHQ